MVPALFVCCLAAVCAVLRAVIKSPTLTALRFLACSLRTQNNSVATSSTQTTSESLSAFLWRGISVYKHSMLPKKEKTALMTLSGKLPINLCERERARGKDR